MISLVAFAVMILVSMASTQEGSTCSNETMEAVMQVHEACYKVDKHHEHHDADMFATEIPARRRRQENDHGDEELSKCVFGQVQANEHLQKFALGCPTVENSSQKEMEEHLECIFDKVIEECPLLMTADSHEDFHEDSSEENEENEEN